MLEPGFLPPLGLTLADLQASPYLLQIMWVVLILSVSGAILCWWRSEANKWWYTSAFLVCLSSLSIVFLTGGFTSNYYLLLYLALIVTSFKGTVWVCLGFCILSSCLMYFDYGSGLGLLNNIAALTKLLLLPFFAIIAFFVNTALNKPATDYEKLQSERLEQAYSITRHQIAEKEESELQLYDRQRKLYSLLQLFQKLAQQRSEDVIKDNVVDYARAEVKSQVAFVAFNEDGRWDTSRFRGINEIMARTISQKIEAGIFAKVIKNGEYINYTHNTHHFEHSNYRRPFDAPGMSGLALRNLLVMPMQDATGAKPFGVLAVANKLMGDAYDQHDEDFLNLLATEAAITISNMRLYRKLECSYYETILGLAQAIEAKDPYTHGHVSRVEQLSVFLCQAMGVDTATTEIIAKAAILHDVGKISIPDQILLKPGPLTPEEFEVMKTHTINAQPILSNITSLPPQVTEIVVHHHERYDGSGYPHHLKGRAIPLGAQIISVADSFDAMITDRPYRRGLSFEEALKRLEDCRETQFSPYILDKFLQNIVKVKDLSALPHYFDC